MAGEKVFPRGNFFLESTCRCVLGTCFIKATNGLSDKVSCGYFREVVKKFRMVTLNDVCDESFLASMLQQTSKWVKNSIILAKLFRHIRDDLGGNFPTDIKTWVGFYEFGTSPSNNSATTLLSLNLPRRFLARENNRTPTTGKGHPAACNDFNSVFVATQSPHITSIKFFMAIGGARPRTPLCFARKADASVMLFRILPYRGLLGPGGAVSFMNIAFLPAKLSGAPVFPFCDQRPVMMS
jgi:hypothetical protein